MDPTFEVLAIHPAAWAALLQGLVEGVAYMKEGPAIVRGVSARPAPTGGHFVATSRGTFVADAEAVHQVLALARVAVESAA